MIKFSYNKVSYDYFTICKHNLLKEIIFRYTEKYYDSRKI